jgi:hypothetical protein
LRKGSQLLEQALNRRRFGLIPQGARFVTFFERFDSRIQVVSNLVRQPKRPERARSAIVHRPSPSKLPSMSIAQAIVRRAAASNRRQRGERAEGFPGGLSGGGGLLFRRSLRRRSGELTPGARGARDCAFGALISTAPRAGPCVAPRHSRRLRLQRVCGGGQRPLCTRLHTVAGEHANSATTTGRRTLAELGSWSKLTRASGMAAAEGAAVSIAGAASLLRFRGSS